MTVTYTTPGGTYPGLYADCLKQTHLLVAGATGSGKSVVINGMMYAALHDFPFDQPGGKQFILIDPKRVELVAYRNLPHVLRYASEPDTMLSALEYAMQLCENRYKVMQQRREKKYTGSDVYVIIDEFADLMLSSKKRVQPLIQRLAQIGRAARIHIVLATQTPIAKVLPTEIKCNFDSRIGLRTRSAQDSRNIIGLTGLETLPRYGYCYYMRPEAEDYYNVPMIPEETLGRMIDHWMQQRKPEKVSFWPWQRNAKLY